VHVGQEDAGYREARTAMGPNRIVGVTCHDSTDLAFTAADAGADYVAFGAFFPTASKEAKTRASPEILRQWSEVTTVPCVAIGGITIENCGALVEAGADFLAVIGAVWGHPQGPAAAVKAFNDAISRHSR
jgi:thiamine-phosphate pyrophosphorylase